MRNTLQVAVTTHSTSSAASLKLVLCVLAVRLALLAVEGLLAAKTLEFGLGLLLALLGRV